MRKTVMVSAALLAAACGGSAQQDGFERATPAFDAVALEITSSDSASSNFENESEPDDDASEVADASVGDPCHPHLFLRTHEVVELTNRGLGRVLGPIHRLLPFGPRHRDGSIHVWERVVNGFDYKYTVLKTGDHSFTATLQVKKEGYPDSSFVTVYSAETDRDPANHDGSGTATLDLDKLASLTGDAVSGQLSLAFTVTSAEKKVIFTMTNFKPRSTATARNGHFVFDKQTGKGGSLKSTEDMTLRCTGATPVAAGTTPVTAVARWAVASDGVHFRGDAGATGGQVPAGEKWEGVTCAQGRDPRETYWLMKLEDATGTTINIMISPSKAGGFVALVRTITDENGKAILCANPGCTQ